MTVHESCSVDALIEAYKRHQRRVKGLREETVRGYERLLRLFLRASLADDPVAIKEAALRRVADPGQRGPLRFHPSDRLIALLEAL